MSQEKFGTYSLLLWKGISLPALLNLYDTSRSSHEQFRPYLQISSLYTLDMHINFHPLVLHRLNLQPELVIQCCGLPFYSTCEVEVYLLVLIVAARHFCVLQVCGHNNRTSLQNLVQHKIYSCICCKNLSKLPDYQPHTPSQW